MNKDRYSQQNVIDALRAAKGIKAAAAQALGCTRQTITNYIDRYPTVKEAYLDACETTLDLAESKLIVLVEKEAWPAIRFLLITKGKDRGYVERQEIHQLDTTVEARFREFEQEAERIHPE